MQVCPTMKVTVLLLVTCELCWTIRVPVAWEKSEKGVEQDAESHEVFSVESFKPRDISEAFRTYDGETSELKSQHSSESIRAQNKKPIPIEYFEYTANKPQLAVDVAAFHGVQSPENHYKAYPIQPYTDNIKPELGKHHILDSRNILHKPFQEYTEINNDVGPVSSSNKAFYPYKAEIPALREIYRDPVLTKIRNDIENSRVRLQKYEKDAGEADVTKEDYLESPQITDKKLFPHIQQPVAFEIHRPQRRPVYYRPRPVHNSREQYLNQRLRYPLNHNIAKVRPVHYRPLKNHIHQLRQNHALKYDDERNEYPEVQISETYSEPKDGYDIYERGKDKFVQLRNNVDESVNRATKDNRPSTYEKLEFQDSSTSNDEKEKNDEEEFIPIKNYAQVRRTETFKHLPRTAALEDAETSDEIKNSPRLREAVKSTKAQTVYSEEGYEDAAYDHAGEQKHASENEGHGGFLKEKELSGGKYKTPSVSASFEDGKGSTFNDKYIHAEKWKDDNKDTKEEADEEDYTDDEHEHLLEADNHQTEQLQDDTNRRNKRENVLKNETLSSSDIQSNSTKNNLHEVDKREVNFEVPQIDLNSTFFNDSEFLKIAKLRVIPKKDTIKQKYPYYFKNLKTISKNSPLRYAENLKLIPKKSKGGTEFYDSRSKFECPEVDDVPDPVPEKLKDEGQLSEDNDSSKKQSSTQGDENFATTKKQPRLRGLGDKIDCFKAKYFGENPLDSPFFKEDIISNPEPAFLPNIAAYKLIMPFFPNNKGEKAAESSSHSVFKKPHERNISDLFTLIEKLKNDQNASRNSTVALNNDFVFSLVKPISLNSSKLVDQSNVYDDIIKNIKTSMKSNAPLNYFNNISEASNVSNQSQPNSNINYTYFQNKEEIMQPLTSRKKRAAPFVYEPYKIIKDGQIQDELKKATVASNISPLIKQLQTSKIMDTVVNFSPNNAQHVKRNVNSRAYKNIGLKDREVKYGSSKNDKSYEDSDIVDVSVDKRRGEPRYEIKHVNHKPKYTPIKNTKSMTRRDYEAQINNDEASRGESSIVTPTKFRKQTEKPNVVALKSLPQKDKIQNTTLSFTLRKPVAEVTSSLKPQITENYNNKDEKDIYTGSNEDYEEYDEEEFDNDKKTHIIPTTTTSTTLKPVLRRKTRLQTTTQEPLELIEEQKLKLVTRFQDYKPKDNQEVEYSPKHRQRHKYNTVKKNNEETVEIPDENIAPKIREKKKKVSQSTIVTDTKKYGDAVENEDQIMKDEVDALIGVTHYMADYVPNYEKELRKEVTSKEADSKHSNENGENYSDVNENEEDSNDDKSDDADDEDDDYDVDESESDEDSVSDEEDLDIEMEITTSEPTKRTLAIMTDAPFPTTASRSAKLQAKPIITRKRVEIHKELPINKSLPHISEFKQDIKEIEIIKETRNPLKKKPNKNVEVFDLYKDDNLAKDINKLGVEVFKENLDLRQGPKHGGNYRNAAPSSNSTRRRVKQSKDDAETSQSKNTKHIEFDDETWNNDDSTSLPGQNSRSRGENSKLVEFSGTPNTKMSRDNLNYEIKSRNTNAKNQKLIELDDDDEHDEDTSSDSLKDNSYGILRQERPRPMHGGNYRSAKLTLEENQPTTTETTKSRPRDARQNAALVLNSFVQAAPVLTTTPVYILDPSKRKYYYVDA